MKPSRLTWVDYAKGIAIILVLYRHVFEGIKYSGIDISGNIGLEYANILFFSFRMPLFFIVSGVFFAGSLKKRGLPGFIDTKARTILYPYFLWGALQVTLQLVFSKYVNGQREPYDYLYLFYLPREVEQFWYLYCLFNVTVLYAITKVTLRISALQNVFIGIVLFYLSALAFRHNITLGFFGDILHYYLFFAIGDLVSKTINNRERFRDFGSAKWIGIIAIPFCIAQVYFLMANMKYADRKYQFVEFYQPFAFLLIALVGCAFVIAVCFKLQQLNRLKWLQELGRHSLYIYVAHVLVLAAVRTFMTRVLGVYNVPVLLVTGSVAGLLVPVLLYKACVKLHCKWLFVLPERKKARSEKDQQFAVQ
jgi:fucose 4-O-acetylase-like acetyltransferase